MKTNILSLLAIAGLFTFAGCANDDTTNNNNDQEPGTEGLTSFVEEDQATRTTGEYDGSGLNFYWTAGDRLWVNTGTALAPVLTQDSKNNINSTLVNNPANSSAVKRVDKAKFWFAGTYTANSYPVRYTGKNGVKDKVTIKATQSQTIPNDASHIGEDGDFAVATATKPVGGGAYAFTLDHKAAYVTFMPYTNQGVVAGAKIQKIRVFTGNASDALAGTFDLADDGTLSNPASTSNSVELTVNNFAIPSTSTYATNAATMVVNPGTYSNVSIEYTLHDPVTGITGTITKTYPSVTFTAGKNKKVSTDLQVKVYPLDGYYMWDAAVGWHYWYGHLDSDGKPDGNYPQNDSDPRWYRVFTSTPHLAYASAKDCPNVNELIWYCMQGDPHWNDELWATLGHLYGGGMWFKKKAKIPGFTDANYNGTDYRMTGNGSFSIGNSIVTSGKPTNLSDYFYLPALGYYLGTMLHGAGTGNYWSSTPHPWALNIAFGLNFHSSGVGVSYSVSYHGFQLWRAE
ncbi:MAG: hypothetical protein ACTTJL_02605 [Hoylesella enoeca]|uniref:hypothetical protein n=1 Tax=Hoylesella enoeca TaxID=76123 RepID=UPI003FA0F98E